MILLRRLSKTKIPKEKLGAFPFNTNVISSLSTINFSQPVTIFVGENGSGKSTLLEGIAAACSLPIVGSKNINLDETLKYVSEVAGYLNLSWSLKNNKGFFLRAEDFFGFTKKLNRLRADLEKEIERLDKKLPDGYGKDLAIGSIRGQISGLTQRYGVDLGAASHGESFLKLFQSRIQPNGLYLLDEPETPLSPIRQMSLLRLISDSVKRNCQFIIATHSPILMAYPNATILNFNSFPLESIKYDEIDHVQNLKGFLLNKETYLKRLLE